MIFSRCEIPIVDSVSSLWLDLGTQRCCKKICGLILPPTGLEVSLTATPEPWIPKIMYRQRSCAVAVVHVVYILDRLYHTLVPFFPSFLHSFPTQIDSIVSQVTEFTHWTLKPDCMLEEIVTFSVDCEKESLLVRMYLSIRNGVCKVFAKNEVGQSNKEQARLEWQALRTGVRNVSNVSVWLTCLSKSLNSNPYATATTRTLPSAESARTLERHLHDPRKVSIHCFVFASCTLFSPRVSLSRRGQGAMFARPSLKVLHMRMLNEETSVPFRAKGQATFKTPEDQNLLSGKQDADPYALYITRFRTHGFF